MEEELNRGLTLLKMGQNGLVHAVFSRMGLILLLLVLHVLLLFSAFRWFENFLPHIYGGAVIFTVGMVLYLLNSRMDPSAKITWLIVVMLLPVFGALLFWYTQSDIGHRALKDRLNRLIAQTRDSIPQSAQVMERLAAEEPGAAALAQYIHRTGCYPVYDRTAVTYFPLGEEKWAEMLRQLEQAEHFIFLEYFIVDEGLMWGRKFSNHRKALNSSSTWSTSSRRISPMRLKTAWTRPFCPFFRSVSPLFSSSSMDSSLSQFPASDSQDRSRFLPHM